MRNLRAAGCLLAWIGIVGCSQPLEPGPVLLITLDTTRKDHLSLYGYERPTTPQLEELAADGLVFDRAVAVSNWTLPTHASILSGLYPRTHGAHWVAEEVPHLSYWNTREEGRKTAPIPHASPASVLAPILTPATPPWTTTSLP